MLSETRPDLVPIFEAEATERVRLLLRDRDFEVLSNELAVGGRLISLRTPAAEYHDVFLALHGRHQAYNFLDAVVAAEEFFGAPIEADLLAEAAATVQSPGRLEVVGRRPLIVLDGAKNIPGAEAMAAAIDEEFGDARSRIMVVGMLRGKDPGEMLQALGAPKARHVITCPPPSPRAQPADVVAKAALLLGRGRGTGRLGRRGPRPGPGAGDRRRPDHRHRLPVRRRRSPGRHPALTPPRAQPAARNPAA